MLDKILKTTLTVSMIFPATLSTVSAKTSVKSCVQEKVVEITGIQTKIKKETEEAREKAEEEEKARQEAEQKAQEEADQAAKEEQEAQQTSEQTSTQVTETVTTNTSWNGSVLSASAGVNYGPSGKETYYNLDMSGVVSIMRGMGNTDAYWVRSDGVKMLGDYVMVAANLSVHPRGSLVETSLGTGIVCDTGGFAVYNANQLDIATSW